MTKTDQTAVPPQEQSSRNLIRVLKASAILWVIWGLAHIAFGVFGLSGFLFGDAGETMKLIVGGGRSSDVGD